MAPSARVQPGQALPQVHPTPNKSLAFHSCLPSISQPCLCSYRNTEVQNSKNVSQVSVKTHDFQNGGVGGEGKDWVRSADTVSSSCLPWVEDPLVAGFSTQDYQEKEGSLVRTDSVQIMENSCPKIHVGQRKRENRFSQVSAHCLSSTIISPSFGSWNSPSLHYAYYTYVDIRPTILKPWYPCRRLNHLELRLVHPALFSTPTSCRKPHG